MSAGKVSALNVKEWDPITCDGNMCEDPIKAENYESSDSQGFTSPKEVVPIVPLFEIMLCPQKKINLSGCDRPLVIFFKENGGQDNTDILQGPPIVSSIPIIKLQAKQAPRGMLESVAH